jgi:hypothetical protein
MLLSSLHQEFGTCSQDISIYLILLLRNLILDTFPIYWKQLKWDQFKTKYLTEPSQLSIYTKRLWHPIPLVHTVHLLAARSYRWDRRHNSSNVTDQSGLASRFVFGRHLVSICQTPAILTGISQTSPTLPGKCQASTSTRSQLLLSQFLLIQYSSIILPFSIIP